MSDTQTRKGQNLPGGMRHPFSGDIYAPDGPGCVVVTRGDGAWGRFDQEGRHLEGSLRECDPQMCNWIGGPRIANHRIRVQSADQ